VGAERKESRSDPPPLPFGEFHTIKKTWWSHMQWGEGGYDLRSKNSGPHAECRLQSLILLPREGAAGCMKGEKKARGISTPGVAGLE